MEVPWTPAQDVAAGQAPSTSQSVVVRHLQRGIELVAQKDFDRAVIEFNLAIHKDPRASLAYNNRGFVFMLLGKYDLALADFNTTIHLDPGFAPAHNNRGYVWLARKEYELVVRDCSRALELDSTMALAYHNRGIARAARGEHNLALADFDAAINLSPQVANVYHSRGLLHALCNHHERAIADFSEAIRFEPRHASSFHHRGLSFAARREYDQAAADHLEALSLGLKLAEVHAAWANVWATAPGSHFREGQAVLEIARQNCEQAQWQDWARLRALAAVEAEFGHFDEAVTQAEKALSLAADADKPLCQEDLEQYRLGRLGCFSQAKAPES